MLSNFAVTGYGKITVLLINEISV